MTMNFSLFGFDRCFCAVDALFVGGFNDQLKFVIDREFSKLRLNMRLWYALINHCGNVKVTCNAARGLKK